MNEPTINDTWVKLSNNVKKAEGYTGGSAYVAHKAVSTKQQDTG